MGFQTILKLLRLLLSGRDLQSRINRIARREIAEFDMIFVKLGIDAWIDRRRVIASQSGNFIRYHILAGGKIAAVTNIEKDLSVLVTRLRGEATPVKVKLPEQYIELPFPLATRPLLWSDANLDNLGKYEMIVGRDQNTVTPQPVTLHFGDRSVAHVLVTGTTGSGKSLLLLSMVLSLAWSTSPADVIIIVLDPKFSLEIGQLAGLPQVLLFQETQDCLDAIAAVKAEMNARKRQLKQPKVFLIVEEFAELGIEAGNGKSALIDPLKSVVGVGRGLGVHVIACTQKATVEVVDTVLRANLPIRLAGQVSTQDESRVATGIPGAGAELLPGKGAFLFVRNGQVKRIQAHYLPEDEIAGIVQQVAAKWHGVTPYAIDINFSAADTTATDGIDGHVATVLAAIAVEDIFDADGTPVRGIKAHIVRILFGEDANTGGANNRIAGEVLRRLQNITTTT